MPFKPSPELRAGVLVTASFAVFLSFLFMAGNVQLFAKTYQVPIYFHYISGLEKNAPVHFSGHKVGRVSSIQFMGNQEAKVKVTVAISQEVVLKEDSQAHIDTLGFMGEKFVELTTGSKESELLKAGESLQGTDPVAMMTIIKQGTELMVEFEKTQDSLQRLVDDLETIVGNNQTNLDQTFQNLNEASKNLKEMTHDLKLHPWKLLRKSGSGKKHFLFF